MVGKLAWVVAVCAGVVSAAYFAVPGPRAENVEVFARAALATNPPRRAVQLVAPDAPLRSAVLLELAPQELGPEHLVASPTEVEEEPEVAEGPESILEWIDDLADDEERHNAGGAVYRLTEAGHEADPALEHALFSPDWQQSHLAAHVLACRGRGEPSPMLARLLVENIGKPDPTLTTRRIGPGPERVHASNYFGLGYVAIDRLSDDDVLFRYAESMLAARLWSDDPDERLDVALILARHGSEFAQNRALGMLVEHLANNDVYADAQQAMCALARYGASAMPYLERSCGSFDEQQRKLAAHVIGHIDPSHALARRLTNRELSHMGFSSDWALVELRERRAR